jgi:hypothetical protein
VESELAAVESKRVDRHLSAVHTIYIATDRTRNSRSFLFRISRQRQHWLPSYTVSLRSLEKCILAPKSLGTAFLRALRQSTVSNNF